MAQYLEDFRAALVEVIGDTWPEVVEGGIYRTRELARIPWEQKANDLPLCVLDIDPQPTAEYGLTNRVDLCTVTIYYVTADDVLPGPQIEKLEALRDALYPFYDATSGGQTRDYPQVTDSMNLPVNQYFLQQAKPYWAGALVLKMVAGVTSS